MQSRPSTEDLLDLGVKDMLSFMSRMPSITEDDRDATRDYTNACARAASGYRAGGSSESASDFSKTFGPETLDTYEIGVKAEWFGQRLRTNLALFTSDYNDIQLDVSPDPNNVTITQTCNAGEAVSTRATCRRT